MAIRGEVDFLSRPVVRVVVRGSFGSVTVEALIDTGFSRALALPERVVIRLGLQPYGAAPAQLGGASVTMLPTYVGEVEWVGGASRCELFGTQLAHALIGRALLDGQALRIDFGAARSVEVS